MSIKRLLAAEIFAALILSVLGGNLASLRAQDQPNFTDRFQASLAASIKQSNGRGTVTEQQSVAPDSAQPQLAAENAALAASITTGPAIKIAVRVTGWQRVPATQLFAAGLDQNTDATLLQLYAEGVEQPLTVRATSRTRLGTNGDISFYGKGLDTRETDTRIYWLIVGTQPGLRFGTPRRIAPGPFGADATENRATSNKCAACDTAQLSAPIPATAPTSFPVTLERRERIYYVPTIQNGPDEENFFGAVVNNGAGGTQTFTLPQLDETSNALATVSVTLQGATITAHQVGVALNDEFIGYTPFFYNQAAYTYRFTVPHSQLQSGTNTVRLTAANGNDDISFIERVSVTYQRRYVAENNRLLFTVERTRNAGVSGFTAPDIQVYDLTNPQRGFTVTARVRPDGNGYRVEVPGVTDNRILLAVTPNSALTPAAVTANEPSNLRENANGADFLIVTPQAFRASVAPLAQLRASQGWRTQVVTLEDIYDEWNDGAKSVTALRDFLGYARQQWRRTPRAVLLVGDASYDPRDALQRGASDFLPTTYTVSEFLETASDAALLDADNDGIEDIALGRLPARTANEAAQMIAKIVAYQPVSATSPDLLLVTDHADDNFFEDDQAELRATLPTGINWREIRRLDQPNTMAMRNQVLDALNQGPAIVQYAGHGVVEGWSTAGYLTSPDAAQLINNNRLSVVLTMSCLNGYFHDLDSQSLAEALLRAPRGAVAVWASSALTYATGQKPMSQEWFRQIYGPTAAPPLGLAIRQAKAATFDLDVRRTWILFGDPTMPVR